MPVRSDRSGITSHPVKKLAHGKLPHEEQGTLYPAKKSIGMNPHAPRYRSHAFFFAVIRKTVNVRVFPSAPVLCMTAAVRFRTVVKPAASK